MPPTWRRRLPVRVDPDTGRVAEWVDLPGLDLDGVDLSSVEAFLHSALRAALNKLTKIQASAGQGAVNEVKADLASVQTAATTFVTCVSR